MLMWLSHVFIFHVTEKHKEYKIKVNAGESHCPKRLVVLGFQSQWPPPPRTPPRLCSASPHPWGGRLPLREAGGLETLTGLTAKRNFKGEGGQTKGKKCTFSEHLCDEE